MERWLAQALRVLVLVIAIIGVLVGSFVTWWFALGIYDYAYHRHSPLGAFGFFVLMIIVPGISYLVWRQLQGHTIVERFVAAAIVAMPVALALGLVVLIWSIIVFPI